MTDRFAAIPATDAYAVSKPDNTQAAPMSL
jgi:hypothetical protein